MLVMPGAAKDSALLGSKQTNTPFPNLTADKLSQQQSYKVLLINQGRVDQSGSFLMGDILVIRAIKSDPKVKGLYSMKGKKTNTVT